MLPFYHLVLIDAPDGVWPEPDDVARLDADPVRCLDPAASAAMVAEIDAAQKAGDTLGGVVEVLVHGLPPASAATCTGTGGSTRGSRQR